MGRPENTISASGPVADFAEQLRLLRQHAGLTLRQLTTRTGLSTATLSVAASGRKLPAWEVARAYVQACGGDADDWRVRWEHAAWFSRVPAGVRLTGKTSRTPRVRRRANGHRFPGGPPPLPVTAENIGEFMECLLRVKIWAGDPPVRADQGPGLARAAARGHLAGTLDRQRCGRRGERRLAAAGDPVAALDRPRMPRPAP